LTFARFLLSNSNCFALHIRAASSTFNGAATVWARGTQTGFFEPLERGASQDPAANSDGSLGLGLYITHEIIRAHGGAVSASSDAGLTVFRVVLPRHEY
jgi:hypothetical protein